jgi:serine/threonine protein kinase
MFAVEIEDHTSFTVPQQLGHYVLRREIGRGGVAVVFEATAERTGDIVAIKVIPSAHICDPNRGKKISREISILAGLDHENIVRFH